MFLGFSEVKWPFLWYKDCFKKQGTRKRFLYKFGTWENTTEIQSTEKLRKGLDSSRYVDILRNHTTRFKFENMFRQKLRTSQEFRVYYFVLSSTCKSTSNQDTLIEAKDFFDVMELAFSSSSPLAGNPR